jgi:hypothetical protein
MPGFILHENASVSCAHSGQAMATAAVQKVKVGGQAVVVQPMPWSISGCSFTTPGGTPQPCLMAQWTSAATRVKVLSMPVLLKDSQATCVPNGTPVTIKTKQTKVMAK